MPRVEDEDCVDRGAPEMEERRDVPPPPAPLRPSTGQFGLGTGAGTGHTPRERGDVGGLGRCVVGGKDSLYLG